MTGIYTGIFAVTLWNIFINKCWPIRRALVVMIIFLYALTTISLATKWSYIRSAFIDNGKIFSTVYSRFNDASKATILEAGIAAFMGTILSDLYMIWCCWIVWGHRWLFILLPVLSLISASATKIIELYEEYFNLPGVFGMLYISFILATTLWCTLFIIYRILSVVGFRRGAEGRLRVYHRFIEVLVESSALYSISLVLCLALTIRNDFGMFYLDVIGSIAKGAAPTLLVGRAAAGHTRPNDNSDESMVSALHFRIAPSELGTTNLQESTMQNTILETDIEAQRERSDELVVVVERCSRAHKSES
ncbi:uncharacterized protein EV420DRAFT_1515411 [Desarmillaria tabescens]|uniref:Uncharacterized protein n=1 Tax=Armillaria tabescens TaxID=1929756 RepID=A0AA39TRN6_ARMTA|nr:uncharacterized protein EV420DRAFT_1515411 [Desarmillaria tabescens]KAK0464218.1 hypothetical protein EV420DRAFT_1515411 [Desarmillaria tabescens]